MSCTGQHENPTSLSITLYYLQRRVTLHFPFHWSAMTQKWPYAGTCILWIVLLDGLVSITAFVSDMQQLWLREHKWLLKNYMEKTENLVQVLVFLILHQMLCLLSTYIWNVGMLLFYLKLFLLSNDFVE